MDGVTLLTPEKKETMIGLKYEEIDTFQAYPGSVIIEYKIGEEKIVKLRYTNYLTICSIIYYKI